jgi:hypothetical protein
MALKIIVPGYLDKTGEALLFAALQNSGAEHITDNEWRFSQIQLSSQKFVAELKVFLPETGWHLADKLKVTILDPSEDGNTSPNA